LKLLLIAVSLLAGAAAGVHRPTGPVKCIGEARHPGPSHQPPRIACLDDSDFDDVLSAADSSQNAYVEALSQNDSAVALSQKAHDERLNRNGHGELSRNGDDTPTAWGGDAHLSFDGAGVADPYATSAPPALVGDSDDDPAAMDDLPDTSDDELDADAERIWKDVERLCGVSDVERLCRARLPTSAPTPSHGANFMKTNKFCGEVDGFFFSTGELGTGYYREASNATQARTTISLEQAIPLPKDMQISVVDRAPAQHRRDASGKRIRNRHRARIPRDTDAALADIRSGHGALGDASWREAGFWAFDTINGNSWTTTQAQVLDRTRADVIMVQETKRAGEEDVKGMKKAARDHGWNLVAASALRTAYDKASGGCAVGVRKGNGIADETHSPNKQVEHRMKLAWTSALMRGGVHCGSVYLKDAAGLCEENLHVLKEIAVAVRQLRGPWILAGDWNITPEVLASSGWLDVVKGTVVPPCAYVLRIRVRLLRAVRGSRPLRHRLCPSRRRRPAPALAGPPHHAW